MSECFVATHGAQLAACGFPVELYGALEHKLANEARARCEALTLLQR